VSISTVTATAKTLEQLRDFARLQVRAGLLDEQTCRREVAAALSAESKDLDAEAVARSWVGAERQALLDDRAGWTRPTDHDRLVAAFDELTAARVVVLQGVDDHWTAKAELERLAAAGSPVEGVAWFTHPDVWHAIDHGMLEINVWHADTANVGPGDALLDRVIGCLERHGLSAHFDEGRIEVAAHWHRAVDEATA
jgi:Domain of unknown function (DUF6891)